MVLLDKTELEHECLCLGTSRQGITNAIRLTLHIIVYYSKWEQNFGTGEEILHQVTKQKTNNKEFIVEI